MIILKSKDEIEHMRKAGEILAACHREIKTMVKPGVTTHEIDQFVEKFLKQHGATPEQKGYKGYAFATCASVNDVICHGFPSSAPSKDGDIVTIDMVVNLNGWLADSAWSIRSATSPSRRRSCSRSPRLRCTKASSRPSSATAWATCPMRSNVRRGERIFRRPRLHRARHRPRHARRTAGAALRTSGSGHSPESRHGHDDRADAEHRRLAEQDRRRRLDRAHDRRRTLRSVRAYHRDYRRRSHYSDEAVRSPAVTRSAAVVHLHASRSVRHARNPPSAARFVPIHVKGRVAVAATRPFCSIAPVARCMQRGLWLCQRKTLMLRTVILRELYRATAKHFSIKAIRMYKPFCACLKYAARGSSSTSG